MHRCFVEWNSADFFAVPSGSFRDVYVEAPGWWAGIESSLFLLMPTPWVFYFCYKLALGGTATEKGLIWTIYVPEFVVFELMSFVDCVCGLVTHTRIEDTIITDG